ncbi:hypothetical protein T484DRAFT_1789219 [Baffinella frigidus]|nr:hypothetical protein T484DRAFT_1789219 [Cryptophyta sp. CCMP2293]
MTDRARNLELAETRVHKNEEERVQQVAAIRTLENEKSSFGEQIVKFRRANREMDEKVKHTEERVCPSSLTIKFDHQV